MRHIPAGQINVADPAAPNGQRQIDTGGFWISETEVPWEAYDVFLLRTDVPSDKRASAEADPGPDSLTRPTPPYNPPDRGMGHDGHPAIGMTHYAADAYCRWLSAKTGRRFRLPTPQEWEYACSAGAAPASSPSLGAVAWFADNADDATHPVARKQPNGWGLYDTLGNVAEWCTDSDGAGVACGGSYLTSADELTCRLQQRQQPAWNASDGSFPKSRWWLADAPFVGFRLVCDTPNPSPTAIK